MPYETDVQTAADLVNAVSTITDGDADDNPDLEFATSADFAGTQDYNAVQSAADGFSTLSGLAGAVMAAAGTSSAAATRSRGRAALYQRSGFPYAPWIWAPESFIAFSPLAAINTPAVGSGDQVVLTLVVPPGYDGVIRRLSHNYNGPGFQQGQGGIIWRLIADGSAVRNFDNLLVEFGSPQVARELDGGIRIFSGQTLQYVVNLPANSGFVPAQATQIICGMSGWFYPRQTA